MDTSAYLARIGVPRPLPPNPESLRALQLAHASAASLQGFSVITLTPHHSRSISARAVGDQATPPVRGHSQTFDDRQRRHAACFHASPPHVAGSQ